MNNSHKFMRTLGTVIATVTLLFVAACGSSPSATSENTNTLKEMTGISATGKLGKKPTIKFKTPFTVKDQTYQIVQDGDGAELKDGENLCIQQIVFDPKTGKSYNSTWESKPDCTTKFTNDKNVMAEQFYTLFKKMRVNSTVVIGAHTQSTSSSSADSSSSAENIAYLMALTIVSTKTVPTRANGKPVQDIDKSLPKVTLEKDGSPSIDAKGLKSYKSNGKLKVQTLLKGDGAKVKETDTVTVQYTGWVLGGDAKKPFDSSWTRGSSTSFSLQQVVSGWTKGLAGQTVGSQVLLIIPPDMGYGSTAQSGIPANSTLVFVVDILDAQ